MCGRPIWTATRCVGTSRRLIEFSPPLVCARCTKTVNLFLVGIYLLTLPSRARRTLHPRSVAVRSSPCLSLDGSVVISTWSEDCEVTVEIFYRVLRQCYTIPVCFFFLCVYLYVTGLFLNKNIDWLIDWLIVTEWLWVEWVQHWLGLLGLGWSYVMILHVKAEHSYIVSCCLQLKAIHVVALSFAYTCLLYTLYCSVSPF